MIYCLINTSKCTISASFLTFVYCQGFQKLLRLKRPVYEACLKSGRSLLEKAQSHEDIQHLENMVSELRDSWDTINGKSSER